MTAVVSIRAATRLPSWLGGRIANAPTPSPLPRELARRKHYDDVGDFLIAHDVTLSDTNFAVPLAHLSGDVRVMPRVDALLREHRQLTDAMLAAVQEEVEHAIRPEVLASVADRLTTTLEACLRIVS